MVRFCWDTPSSDDKTYYIWCDGQICQKRVATSSWGSTSDPDTGVKANYYGDGETRHDTIYLKTKYFYNYDHQGSVREVTDSSKNVVAAYDYTPFGERLWKGSGSDTFNCEFAYTGHFYHPQTGHHLALFRAYDPRTGRWLSQDPLGESGGLNLYGYMINDPLNGFDPDGRMPEWVADVALWVDDHGGRTGAQFWLGFSDNWLLGVPKMIREADGRDSTADPCSGWYKGGEWTSVGAGLATGGKGLLNFGKSLKNGGVDIYFGMPNVIGHVDAFAKSSRGIAQVVRNSGGGIVSRNAARKFWGDIYGKALSIPLPVMNPNALLGTTKTCPNCVLFALEALKNGGVGSGLLNGLAGLHGLTRGAQISDCNE